MGGELTFAFNQEGKNASRKHPNGVGCREGGSKKRRFEKGQRSKIIVGKKYKCDRKK